MKRLLLASTSTVHGKGYLEYILPQLKLYFKDINELLFVPYARPGGMSHDDYTNRVAQVFNQLNIKVKGIHQFENPLQAVENAEAIFTGGGNTFLLVKQLCENNLMQPIKYAVENGALYFGTSAGSNIAGISMQTTNDMPIIYPPSFDTLGLIPANLNPHYLDPDPNSKHMGETRETRIKEFHTINSIPVIGLREGSWLDVNGDDIVLKGNLSARIFLKDKEPFEAEAGSLISNLI